jgi:histidyl-tRNA synthetase
VLDLLDVLNLRYVVDHRLVRGLDYYTRTTFEFVIAGREGQQQAIGGGGRYDGLAELLGGRPTPGIGFGIGLDRTVLAMEEQGVALPATAPLVAVVGTGDDQADRLKIAGRLRDAGLRVRPDGSSRKLGKQLEAASKAGAGWAVIVGDELGDGMVGLKDLGSGEQETVALDEVATRVSG